MNYKDTLHLPQTSFPMKGNLPQNEPKRLEQWAGDNLYARIREKSAGHNHFVLHDGPPYANGNIHMGHALNKVLKDIIVKSRTMSGLDAPYVPGWDCHGLPIEHQVLKKLGPKRHQMPQISIRRACREHAQKFIKVQKKEFARLGVLGDWDAPYLTMDPAYEADTLRQLARFVETGGVYKGKKPVHWCASCETALAEAEVEYADVTSSAIYVRFRLDDDFAKRWNAGRPVDILIWTTTPWTLPANKAICVNYDVVYQVVKHEDGDFIVAEDLVDSVCAAAGIESPEKGIKATASGFLVDARNSERTVLAQHPFLDIQVPIIYGDHVTTEAGTGCVHTAPGHGQDDYEVGLAHGLEVYAPVDATGRYTQQVEHWAGMKVTEANPKIIEHLNEKGALLAHRPINHSYPHCWRCKNPILFRATAQWFISMDEKDLRQRTLAAIDRVEWIPKWGRERIHGMMENRPDWCISRQRVWGVPIIAWTCGDCGEATIDADWINQMADRTEGEATGVDFWFDEAATGLLPEGAACGHCRSANVAPERDILDVWFDSGVSHAAVLRRRPELGWPADLYLEGSDQHRGWFHSSLLVGIGVDGQSPYKAVLTHGFVVDGKGKKMSKSVGNVVAPEALIKQYGAEILRLWVAAEDYRDDVRISDEIISHLTETYRKIRNTCRFLLASLSDYDPEVHGMPEAGLTGLDRWALHQLNQTIEQVREAYDSYNFHQVIQILNRFCVVDLSTFYLDITKDAIYCEAADDPGRRATQGVMYRMLMSLTRLMAPVLSFTAEELWEHMPEGWKRKASVHLAGFPKAEPAHIDAELAACWERFREVRGAATREIETKRRDKVIRQSLEASVTLYADDELATFLEGYGAQLDYLLITSQAAVRPLSDAPKDAAQTPVRGLKVTVAPASGTKCNRCWIFREDVGSDPAHPEICARCAGVVGGLDR
ncbi:MAG: isoleucine--tRNA ligase [Leptospirillia bacterium]